MPAVDDEHTLRTALERYDDIDVSYRGSREAIFLTVQLRNVVQNLTGCMHNVSVSIVLWVKFWCSSCHSLNSRQSCWEAAWH